MTGWAKTRWSRLAPRERVGLVAFIVVALGFVGYRFLLKPWSLRTGKTSAERKTLQQQVTKLQDSLIAMEQERQDVQQQREEAAKLKDEVDNLERQILASDELGQLLGHLAKQGQGLGITFESMAQEVDESGERPEVKIDLVFASPYAALASYFRRIEELSPYLTITDFEVSEPAEGPSDAQEVKASLRTPLRPAGSGASTLAKNPPTPEPIVIARSPFHEVAKHVPLVDVEALQLTGITFRGEASTAIINDEVVRVGDKVKELQITKILPDQVIVSDGSESHAIPLNK